MGVVIGIVIGIGLAAIGYFAYNNLGQKAVSQKFVKEQKKIAARLIEKKNSYEKEFNEEVQEKIQGLKANYEKQEYAFQQKKEDLNSQRIELENKYNDLKQYYEQQSIKTQQEYQEENNKEISKKALMFSEKLKALEEGYKEQSSKIDQRYEEYFKEVEEKRNKLTKEIEDYENQQQTIIEQFKQAEELREQQDYYHIKLNGIEKQDVARLKGLALEFSKPEILYKLLYDVYYKTRLEEMFKRVLGDNATKGGIYKITNIKNQKAYVGRTTKLIDRWRTHSKRGCNIDRISGQLYDAMFEEGLENFTFQIVEVCGKEEQSEKEKYWIKFFKTDEYGYNSNKGG